jgi:hypothetical protein
MSVLRSKAGIAFWRGHLLFKPSPQSNTGRKICVTPILPHIGRESDTTVVS